MSIQFRDMVNLVLADGFDETDRGLAKNWLNNRHAWLWGADEWEWRYAQTAVTFTVGSQTVGGAPTDLRMVVAMWDSQGNQLTAVRDLRLFFDSYNANIQQGSGTPEAFTVLAGTLMVGPAGDGTTGLLLYERNRTPLVDDIDTSGLPDGFDLALVAGAKAEGFRSKYPGTGLDQPYENEFAANVAALQRDYLTSVRGEVGQFGAYRPGQPVY